MMPRRQRRWLLAAVALVVAGYLSIGVFTVAADEQAVVRRFGRVTARLGPGIHYRLPWPVDKVNVLKTTTVMKTGVGFQLPDGESVSVTGMELLTGDTNIISIAIAIQFVIANPAAYLFEMEAPAALIGAIEDALRGLGVEAELGTLPITPTRLFELLSPRDRGRARPRHDARATCRRTGRPASPRPQA